VSNYARPRTEDRRTIEAIIWRLDNGAKWRSIPAQLSNWHHAYLRFRRWAARAVWAKIRFSRTCVLSALCGVEDSGTEEFEPSAAIHRPLEHLQPIDLALDRARCPREIERGLYGADVALKAGRKVL